MSKIVPNPARSGNRSSVASSKGNFSRNPSRIFAAVFSRFLVTFLGRDFWTQNLVFLQPECRHGHKTLCFYTRNAIFGMKHCVFTAIVPFCTKNIVFLQSYRHSGKKHCVFTARMQILARNLVFSHSEWSFWASNTVFLQSNRHFGHKTLCFYSQNGC